MLIGACNSPESLDAGVSKTRNPLPASSVTLSVTAGAERNQILHDIPAELAPCPYVMNL